MELRIPREYIVAARLADPQTRSLAEQDQQVDWSAVLQAMVENRVPLHSLNHSSSDQACPLYNNVDFQKASQAEYQSWKGQRDQYGELRQALLQKGIQSVLFKSTGLTPSFPYTSDNLDTLVRSENTESGREVLNSLGYVELRNIEEPKKWLFRKFKGGESISAIHLHGVVGWGVPFLDDDALWKRAQPSEDDPWVTIPSPEDALLVTIAHAFYENKSFKLLDIARIRHCLRRPNLDFKEAERIARERGWEDGLAFSLLVYDHLVGGLYGETLLPQDVLERARSVVASHKWLSKWLEKVLNRPEARFPFRVSFALVKLIYYLKVLNDSRKSLASRVYDVISTLAWGIKQIFHIHGQRGMIVSFSGIDGSGKTVHSRELARAFEIAEVKTRIYWSRFGSSEQKIKAGDRPVESQPTDIAAELNRRRQRLQNPLLRAGWLAVNLFAYIFRCNWYVRLPRWFGGVVICDRYIYSAMVEIRSSLPQGSRWVPFAGWLLAHLCPRPDVAWLLDAPAQVTLDRQEQEKGGRAAVEELTTQREAYLSLAQVYGLKVLSTSKDLDSTGRDVVHDTLVKYYEDFGTWINAILLSNPSQMNPSRGLS